MPISRSEQVRANGAKSRGPKTAEGKARSSMNALKHGRYATNAIVLKNEDSEAFEELVAYCVRRVQPTDPVEYQLTRELAAVSWLLTRVYALDTRLLDQEMDVQAPAFGSAGMAVPELSRVSTAGRSIVERSQYPNYLARRQAQLMRSRQSILAVLKDLRKNFPLAESSTEIIPPQPLNPELPVSFEPKTNRESGAAPQVCAEPPGSAANQMTLASDSLALTAAPQISLEEPPCSAAESGAALQSRAGSPDPAPEQTLPEPANILPICSESESGELAPILTSNKSVPGAASEEAMLGSSSTSLKQQGAQPGGSAMFD